MGQQIVEDFLRKERQLEKLAFILAATTVGYSLCAWSKRTNALDTSPGRFKMPVRKKIVIFLASPSVYVFSNYEEGRIRRNASVLLVVRNLPALIMFGSNSFYILVISRAPMRCNFVSICKYFQNMDTFKLDDNKRRQNTQGHFHDRF